MVYIFNIYFQRANSWFHWFFVLPSLFLCHWLLFWLLLFLFFSSLDWVFCSFSRIFFLLWFPLWFSYYLAAAFCLVSEQHLFMVNFGFHGIVAWRIHIFSNTLDLFHKIVTYLWECVIVLEKKVYSIFEHGKPCINTLFQACLIPYLGFLCLYFLSNRPFRGDSGIAETQALIN